MRTRYGVKISADCCGIRTIPIYGEEICSVCGDELVGFLSWENEEHLCPTCLLERCRVDGDTEPCFECGENDWNDTRYEKDGHVICSDCLINKFFI